MEHRILEFNIISAKDLKDVNRFSMMDVYAVVSLTGDPLHRQRANTHVHKDCGPNPTWNFPVKFSVNESLAQQNRLTLEVQLISDRILGDTVVGSVHIPIKELLDNAGDNTSFRQLNYHVKKPSGTSEGTFNFSYKFGEHVAAPATEGAPEPVMAYPPPAAGFSSVRYPPAQPGYGYPQQPGYGYPQAQKPNKNKFWMRFGLIQGATEGLVSAMIEPHLVSDAATYDAGYAGCDGGGFAI